MLWLEVIIPKIATLRKGPEPRHSNIDSADGPIGSQTQNSERSVLENCLNQCQLLLLLSELHLEILKLC